MVANLGRALDARRGRRPHVVRLRELGDGVEQIGKATDVVIEIAKHVDGSIRVLPAAVV